MTNFLHFEQLVIKSPTCHQLVIVKPIVSLFSLFFILYYYTIFILIKYNNINIKPYVNIKNDKYDKYDKLK